MEDAIECYENALQADSNYAPALNNLSGIHFAKGGDEAALALLTRLIQGNPSEVNGRVNMGYIYLKQGNLAKARQRLEEALALDPQNSRAQDLLTSLMSREED